MRRLFKIVGIILGVLLALVVVAVLLIPLWFDPNDYKDQIVGMVERQTGREVTIEGELDLSVFPWLGVEVGRVRMANAQGFGDEPMVRVENADIRVKLVPLLLRREVEMDTVRLEGVVLNLARDQAGRTNWEDLTAAPEAPPQETGGGGRALGDLALGGIRITNATVNWDDRSTGARYTLTRANLQSGAIVPGRPFDLSLEFDFETREPALNGHVTLAGEASIAPDAGRYQLHGTRLTALVKGKDLPPDGVAGQLTGDITADLNQQTLSLPDLALTVAGINARGSLQGKSILDAPAVQGALRVAEFNPRELLQRLGQTAPDTADPEALRRARADLKLAASTQDARFDEITVQLDGSTLTGQAAVRDFAKPAITFDLALDNIDVDRYLPPPSQEEPPPAATPTGAAGTAEEVLPVELLRGLNLNGTLRIGQVKVSGLRANNIQLKLAAKDGVLRMQPATAELYQGKYEGNMSLDVRGAAPRLAVNDKLTGVQAGPLLKDLAGKEWISGTANVSAQLNAVGLTPEAIRGSLNGNASFAFRDGAVQGINIAQLIRQAQASLKGQQAPPAANQTDFSELTGTLNITDGVVRNRDLSVKSPLLRVTGEGMVVDLKTEQVDYLVNAVLVGSLEGQGGKELEELKGVTIPVRVGGTMSDLAFRLDLEKALGAKVRGKVQERVEKEREELKERLDKKLQEGLKGLLR